MHIHIATMGKATEPVKKAFQALGFDKLYLISNEKYRESIDEVTESLQGFNIRTEFMETSGFDFQEVVNTIYHIYEMEKDNVSDISINITGGTNLMTAAACSCAFFIGATIYYVLNDENLSVKEQVIPIPTPRTPDLKSMKQETKDILKYILERTNEGKQTFVSDIVDRFERTKQSTGHHIKLLKNEGLIDNERHPESNGKVDRRVKIIELTPQGRLIASWI